MASRRHKFRADAFREQREGRDRVQLDLERDDAMAVNLGDGQDIVGIRSGPDVGQIRLTIGRAEVGNGNPNEGTTPPADGGLAARIQAEDMAGALFGPVHRFDDEGITFRTPGGVKFDVRDLTTGAPSGIFDVAVLGTGGADLYDFKRKTEDYYIHGGLGDDLIRGGSGNDHPVGGGGNDTLEGGAGDDLFVGGFGNDLILGGEGNDTAVLLPAVDGADTTDLGSGNDVVRVIGAPVEIRLTWSTLQTGNGDPNDSGSLAKEDGGLNVRFQAEDSAGNLTGLVSRYDDEGISFVGGPGITFDLRNLPDGVMRGNGYSVVRLGSSGDEVYDDSASTANVFHNGGRGDDQLTGGSGADHLVGLDGNDRINGGAGNDLLVGLGGIDTFVFAGSPGRDTILTYQPGTDKIDLSAYGIGIDDVQATTTGPNTLIGVDTDGDGTADFEIFLGGSAAPQASDYIF